MCGGTPSSLDALPLVGTGVDPPSGVLLHGPSGCGKTLLGRAIAGELGVAFQYVAAPQLIGGVSGESEQKVRAARPHAHARANEQVATT